MFDVVVIGGGVVGAMILRELSRYNLKVCLLEAEDDVCMGQSKANSGIVHAGFDAKEGTKKAFFNVCGNRMMKEVCNELGVKYRNNGSLVVAFNDEQKETVNELKKRGEANGVDGLEILDREELLRLEPNVSENAVGALYAKTGGIVCPYNLTFAAIGNAMDNGAELKCNFKVVKIDKIKDGYRIFSSNYETLESKIVINSAGINSGKIAALTGDDYAVHARRGEYVLLDKTAGRLTNATLFFTPTKLGKGILVSPTADGNIILGPTAEDIEDNNTDTTAQGLSSIIRKASEMMRNVPFGETVTSFSGVRAYNDRHDFIIEESKNNVGIIHLVGIESPGLTASPAIGKYVVEEIVGKKITLVKKSDFNPYRKPEYFFNELSDDEKNEIIKRNPEYGKIVCRCEKITEGEIVSAIRTNPKATSVDAVKRRTRAGMGRCQGGFCQPSVVEILARELGKDLTQITGKGEKSEILAGRTK